MAWRLASRTLAEGVERRRARVAENPSWTGYELLARGLRWIDEVDESQRLFHAAAVDLIERMERLGRGDGAMWARATGFFRMAGEPESAREWARRAIDGLDAPTAVDTLFAGGDVDAALALAQREGIRTLAVELVEAARDGDLARLDAVAAKPVREIVGGRFAPFEAGGVYPLDSWDWLELAHLARARLAGEPAPTHTEMLSRSGLLGPERRRPRAVRHRPGGTDRITVPGRDGAPLEALVDRESPDYVELRLDPRPDSYLALGFDWTDGDGYTGSLFVEPRSSPQDVLPFQGKDLREVIDAAVDWLESIDEPWAARTLRTVAGQIETRGSG
ncbi:hypothetical protein OJ997_16635 [Solirubrobacter phytolaccae]|uniref:Uncharacterized protein n=1 Tax=Solirubrobacter phytolaccae TaxID=1404360 RepID=A0A9X3NII6_9ACTN|nr:hypothetical protein [Solirubrobacter phytolaccae]MDA0181932.1 hypothetical protein [Solirubrobacter phytolaccae]